MALNVVDLREDIPLGFGLDFRLNHNEISEAATLQVYCKKSDISSSSEVSIADEMDSEYKLNGSAESQQISSTDASDSQTITIYYYASSSDTTTSSQTVVLNGQTAVNITNDIYRIHRMVVTSIAGMNAGNVYISPQSQSLTNGKPDDNIRCSMPANRGFSAQSYFFVPSGWKCYLIQQNYISNCSSSIRVELNGYRQPSSLVPSLQYNSQKSLICHPHIELEVNTPPAINAGTTVWYTVKKDDAGSDNANLELYLDFVMVR